MSFKVYVNSGNIPNLTDSTNNVNGAAKVIWNNMTEKDI